MTNKDYKIWCLVERDDEPFCVRVPCSETVNHFKELIVQASCEKNNVLHGVDPHQLILRKVSHIMTANDGS
jgi:hypothetical protein